MTAIRILSVAFAAGLAAFAATGAGFAQDDSDKASGSMMDQKSGGGIDDGSEVRRRHDGATRHDAWVTTA